MQPLATTNQATSWDTKNHGISWDKKKSRNLSAQKKTMQPFRTKKMQSIRTKKLRHLSGQQKITQPLRTKKITQTHCFATAWGKKITYPLGTKKFMQMAPNYSKCF